MTLSLKSNALDGTLVAGRKELALGRTARRSRRRLPLVPPWATFFSLRVRHPLQPWLTVGKGTAKIETAAWPPLARRLVVANIRGSHRFGRAATHQRFGVALGASMRQPLQPSTPARGVMLGRRSGAREGRR